ncbi:MAG: septum formation initiator family protein [Chrysiogenetes bacterium]|nr:septum formation initiator family protein [Chrysiogenetes bacterium]
MASLAAAFALGFSLYNFVQSAVQVRSLAVQNAEIEARVAALAADNHALARRIKVLREDPQATERIIRQELGLVRAGELVYRFR